MAEDKKTDKPEGKEKEEKTSVVIAKLRLEEATIRVEGDTPYIMHKWSEKAKKAMRDKHLQKPTTGREKRNPEAEFEDATYKRADGTFGIPALSFKSAMVRAGKAMGFAMTDLRGALYVYGDDDGLIELEGRREMVEDVVRLKGGSTDLRYRPYFYDWSCELRVKFNAAVLSLEQVVSLLDAAGFSCGVGDYRPEKSGENGMFHVVSHEG